MSNLSSEFVALQEALAGRYSLERELERGPVVVEFLARDVALDRPVVLKLLRGELAERSPVRSRFLEAARQASALFHPNILPTHAVEELDGFVFVVTTSVEGETVADRVEERGPMTPSEVRKMVEDAAWALSHAHARGVYHGDLGPRSLVREEGSGRMLVVDFGLAHAAGGAKPSWHVAPEQRGGRSLDARSDLYALGATTWYALTGHLPSSGWEPPEGSPPRLVDAVRECLARDPARRPASAMTLAHAIAERGVVPASLPPAVHRLLRRIRRFSPVAGIGVVVLWLIRDGAVELLLTPLIALAFGAMGMGLLRSAREVLREGLDAELITFILEEEVVELQARGDASARGFQNFAIGCGGVVFALGAIPVSIFAIATVWSVLTGGGVVGLSFLGDMSVAGALLVTFLFLAGPSLPKDSPLRLLDWGERMMVGRFGRLLFRLARIGLSSDDRRLGPADAGQPTEILVSTAAEEVFSSLPRDLQARFPDVPKAIDDLRTQVASLHRRDEALAEAMGRITAPPSDGDTGEDTEDIRVRRDLEAARDRVRERIGEAVAALEHLRLNMMYLGAGSGTEDDLTLDLQRARELSDELGHLDHAWAEVRSLLEGDPEGSP